MRVQDPVCGMTFDVAEAAVRTRHEGLVFYFCAQGCATRFREDPGRYMEPSAAAPPEAAAAPEERRCPGCGGHARSDSAPQPELGALSMDEAEILVRNEWRRRLGHARYPALHPRSVIRWTLRAVLRPEDDRLHRTAARALLAEVARSGGTTEIDPQRELGHLIDAVQSVIPTAGRGPERIEAVRRRISACLRSLATASGK